MERVQATLQKQLLRTQERVKDGLLRQKAALRAAKKRREDVGVKLYGIQQQLDRLQGTLDSVNDKHAPTNRDRAKGEKAIADLKEAHANLEAKAGGVRDDVAEAKAKLEGLRGTLRRAKTYNDEVKSEVLITRRVAHKTGEAVRGREKEKLAQDMYIDGLLDEAKRLEAEVEISEVQLKEQRKQTEEKMEMIHETNAEVEALAFEKKQLFQQWKSSVLALNRRDKALEAAVGALNQSHSQLKTFSDELEDLRIKQAHGQSDKENLILTSHRFESEVSCVKQQASITVGEHDSAVEEIDIVGKAIEANVKEEGKVANAIRKLENNIETVNHNIEHVTRTRKELEQQIGTSKHEQTIVSKATMVLLKEENALVAQIHDKELETAKIENQIARLGIDVLNSKAKGGELGEDLAKHELGIKRKYNAIHRCEANIRERNGKVQEKMNRFDQLNRKLEKMTNGFKEDEHMGPLEAKVAAIGDEINVESEESERLRKECLKLQTALIKTISDAESIQEINGDLNARLNVMKQTRLRLIQNIHSVEADNKSIKVTTKGMHSDIVRLNELIGKFTKQRDDLKNCNEVIEEEFLRQMREWERGMANLDTKISEIRAARDKIAKDIAGIERQALTWEKKVQIEKETQTALFTNNDAKEIAGMEKEIFRMKHRLGAIRRDHEITVREMEKAILKQADIEAKYGYSSSKAEGVLAKQVSS